MDHVAVWGRRNQRSVLYRDLSNRDFGEVTIWRRRPCLGSRESRISPELLQVSLKSWGSGAATLASRPAACLPQRRLCTTQPVVHRTRKTQPCPHTPKLPERQPLRRRLQPPSMGSIPPACSPQSTS